MVDSDIMESLAHQTRGAAIMYFLILHSGPDGCHENRVQHQM